MMDIGVARPNAQGHATISTATAFTSACASRGSGPYCNHTTNVMTATAMTMGANILSRQRSSAVHGKRRDTVRSS